MAQSRESIVITKRGKPIARVIPFGEPNPRPKPGRLEGTLISEGDIVSPLGPKLWQAAE